MINGNLDQFLDTGWYSEAELFYKGFIYWCEGQWDKSGTCHFFVNRFPAIVVEEQYYRMIIEDDDTVDVECVFELFDHDIDLIKRKFLEAKIFDGKSFWEIEKVVAWLDEYGNNPIYRRDIVKEDYMDRLNSENG